MANIRIKDLKQGKTVWWWQRTERRPSGAFPERDFITVRCSGYAAKALVLKCKTTIINGEWPRVKIRYQLRTVNGDLVTYSDVVAVPLRRGNRRGILADALNTQLHNLYDRATVPNFPVAVKTQTRKTLK